MTVSKPFKRDPAGRFVRGTRGGPGRPSRATETAYLAALSEACPVELWARIVRVAVEQALAGDHQARAWLARFLIGDRTISHGAWDGLADLWLDRP